MFKMFLQLKSTQNLEPINNTIRPLFYFLSAYYGFVFFPVVVVDFHRFICFVWQVSGKYNYMMPSTRLKRTVFERAERGSA